MPDTFCLFNSEHDTLLFFDYANTGHPNIRFNTEREVDSKLPFLAFSIDNSQSLSSPITTVYQEKTITGLSNNIIILALFLVPTNSD